MKSLTDTNPTLWAIVPAAGVGRRFGQSTAKQYARIHGKTILEHSVYPLLKTKSIKKIIVALPENDTEAQLLPLMQDPRIEFVVGGKTRARSVLNALLHMQQACDSDDWILIHDAARPCLSMQDLERLIRALVESEIAVILATPSTDTLKHVTNYRIDKTIDRDSTWQALTPQAFRYSIILSALQSALREGINITDESSAIEASGQKPLLINGLRSNIKITYPEDLELATFYLSSDRHSSIDTQLNELHL